MNTILKGLLNSIIKLMQINKDIFVYLKVYLRFIDKVIYIWHV